MAAEPPSLEELQLVKPPWKGPPPRIVESLFLRCTEVIMSNGPNMLQKACKILPPPLLRYLLYRAIKGKIHFKDTTYIIYDTRNMARSIECLVRYWPFETLSFDFSGDNIDDSDRDYGLAFDEPMVDAIALGIYSRVFESQSVDQATSGTKRFIVDLSMVLLYDLDVPKFALLAPLKNLCLGVRPSDPVGDYHDPPERVTTCTGNEKVLIKVSESWVMLALFLNTSPCSLISNRISLPCNNVSVDLTVLEALETMTSLDFTLESSSCGPELAKIFTHLKEKGSSFDAITISGHRDLNINFSIPLVPCRRIVLNTRYSSLFDCACCHLQSLGIKSGLEFDGKVSKIIEYNCESLLDLQIDYVEMAKNGVLLLQETFQKCHALVVLFIHNINANDKALAYARLHEIFCSIQCLVSLEHLSVSDSAKVLGEDLCALHNLLYQGVPKLTKCELSFPYVVIRFRQLKDPKFKSIQELLVTLLSGKKPYLYDEQFIWGNNQIVHTWLANLRCNVNFKLSHHEE